MQQKHYVLQLHLVSYSRLAGILLLVNNNFLKFNLEWWTKSLQQLPRRLVVTDGLIFCKEQLRYLWNSE